MGKINSNYNLTKLKIIPNNNGPIYHGINKNDLDFKGFGELYFSKIDYKAIKAWKYHTKQTCNFLVPIGEVLFVTISDEKNSIYNSIKIGEKNYCRLSIPPSTWFGFMGLGKDINLITNLSDFVHNPSETINKDLEYFDFDWSQF